MITPILWPAASGTASRAGVRVLSMPRPYPRAAAASFLTTFAIATPRPGSPDHGNSIGALRLCREGLVTGVLRAVAGADSAGLGRRSAPGWLGPSGRPSR